MGIGIVTPAQFGVHAHEESVSLTFPELVTRLREMLGARLVAYLGNVRATRPVSSWADGTRSPGQADEQRLRTAYQVAALLRESGYAPVTVQSWFLGLNPALDYTAPARVLVEDSSKDAETEYGATDVITAALSFAHQG